MLKLTIYISYTLLKKRITNSNSWFAGATNIYNKFNLRILYRKLDAEFGVSSFYISWELCVHAGIFLRSI